MITIDNHSTFNNEKHLFRIVYSIYDRHEPTPTDELQASDLGNAHKNKEWLKIFETDQP